MAWCVGDNSVILAHGWELCAKTA